MKKHRPTRTVAAALAFAALLPLLSVAPAIAAPKNDSTVTSAMKAQADRDSAAGFARIKAGGTASFDECATKAKLKPKGTVSCSRPSTPAEVDPANLEAMLADIDRDLGAQAPPPEPEPVAGEPVTAYGVGPAPAPYRPFSCASDGHRYDGRMRSCSIYNFTVDIVQDGGKLLGQAFLTAVEWDQLSSTSRSWTHHLTVRVNQLSWGPAETGSYVWTAMRCSFPCQVSNEIPVNSWVWVPKGQNYYGSGTMKSDLAFADYVDHNTNIYTLSPVTSPGRYSVTLTNSPDQIRCDRETYVSTAKIGGCAYWRQPGYLKLWLNDPLTKESARFVYDTRNNLPGHPGLLGWPALTRATPAEKAANDAARSGPCDIARAAFALTDTTPEIKKDCDEYPFQSTAQGAASGPIKINWDIKILNADHNRLVGSKLAALYATERFWYGDHFYVQFHF